VAPSTLLAATSWSTALAVAGVALVTAAALWGMFRRGSVADRARHDDERLDLDPDPDPDGGEPVVGEPPGPPEPPG
jgi:hypothetical protein